MESTAELVNEYIAQLTKEVQEKQTELILLKSQLAVKERELDSERKTNQTLADTIKKLEEAQAKKATK